MANRIGNYLGGYIKTGSEWRFLVFNPGFLLFPTSDSSLEIQGKISTQPSNVLQGENNCTHVNLTGVLVPQFGMTKVYSNTLETTVSAIRGDWYYKTPEAPCVYPYMNRVTYSSRSVVYGQFRLSHYASLDDEICYSNIFPSLATGSYGLIEGTRTLFYSKRYVYGHHIIYACNAFRDVYNRYPSCETWAVGIDFDIRYGARIVSLASAKTEAEVYPTIERFIGHMDSLYLGQFLFGGSYSWEAGYDSGLGIPYLGVQQPGALIAEDVKLSNTIVDRADEFLSVELPSLGDMSYNCVSQLEQFTGNNVGLARDLIALRTEVVDVLRLIMGWRNPKNWASLFLSAKYGIPLTIKDIRKLIDVLVSFQKDTEERRVSSSKSWSRGSITYLSRYGIYVKRRYGYWKLIGSYLEEFHIIPDYSDLWDLVPFSFVVDWFKDVGGLLENIDTVDDLSHFDILGSMFSEKITTGVNADKLGYPGYSGQILLTKYIRTMSSSACPPSIQMSDKPLSTFDHWIEGAALILQKIFH